MANLQHASNDRTARVSAISNIADARSRRERVGEIADWVVGNIPCAAALQATESEKDHVATTYRAMIDAAISG